MSFSPSERTARRMALVWGVHPVVTPPTHGMSESVAKAIRIAVSEGFATHGQTIVVIAGVPFGIAGTTNALRVATVK